MPLYHLLLLAVIQGVTEFLPVSSSGHLILLPGLTGLADQGVALDVAVHVGTLVAVIAYFWTDVKIALRGTGDLIRGRFTTAPAYLALCLILATIPVVILGFVLHVTGWSDAMRNITVIGWTMLIFGLVLYWADQTGAEERAAEQWTFKHALVMGLAQMLALIPGTSRSGITVTAARKLGYAREGAARLAMLMSIPTILASGVVLSVDVVGQANWALARDAGIAAIFACLAAWIALALMMYFLRRISFTPYVIYRCILGVVLLGIAYS